MSVVVAVVVTPVGGVGGDKEVRRRGTGEELWVGRRKEG